MYAIVEQGGKQHKVSEGESLQIELVDIAADAKTIELDKVLFVNDGQQIKLGNPYIEGAKVIGRFDTNAENAVVKGQKLYPMQFRRRKNSRRRIGHRQRHLQLTIDKIVA